MVCNWGFYLVKLSNRCMLYGVQSKNVCVRVRACTGARACAYVCFTFYLLIISTVFKSKWMGEGAHVIISISFYPSWVSKQYKVTVIGNTYTYNILSCKCVASTFLRQLFANNVHTVAFN